MCVYVLCMCLCVCECIVESEVTQSCPTLCDPMDCSLPGSSVHGISQARVLEWDATINSLRGRIESSVDHLWPLVECSAPNGS